MQLCVESKRASSFHFLQCFFLLSLINSFLSLHYLPTQFSRFIPLCVLCNYLVLVCILFIKRPFCFCLHLFSVFSLCFIFCSYTLLLALHTCVYVCVSIFLHFFISVLAHHFLSSPPPFTLSIQLRLGGLHCTSQCRLNVPAGPASVLLEPVSLTVALSHTLADVVIKQTP